MPLPTLEKTWHFATRQIVTTGTQLDDLRSVLRWVKDQMKALGSNPWTVDHSCNSVTAGAPGDGVDRWSADSNLVFAAAGVAHSWIVLKQTGIGASFQLLIDLGVSTDPRDIHIFFSWSAGFTGGTTTARPTATDECAIHTFTNDNWIAGSANSFFGVVAQSGDGQCTRFWLIAGGASGAECWPVTMWLFDRPKNTPAGWTETFIGLMFPPQLPGGNCVEASSLMSGTPRARARVGSINAVPVFLITDVWTGTATLNITEPTPCDNDFSGDRFLTPVSLASETPGTRGCLGVLYDLWFQPYGTNSTGGGTTTQWGSTYPDDLTYQLVSLGVFVHPWNGTLPYLG